MLHIPTQQWRQDNPAVAAYIAAGRVEWKPKKKQSWPRLAAAMDNGCSKNVASRVAKEHGVRRPGCPPFSYTKDEEKRVIRWLLHPSISYPHIAKKVGLKENTILFIASRNGIRRRLPSFYRGEIPHQT